MTDRLYDIPANTLGWLVRLRAMAKGNPPTLEVKSKAGLSEQTGLTRSRIKPLMDELKDKGYIETEKIGGPGWRIVFVEDVFELEGDGEVKRATTPQWEFGRVADIFAPRAEKKTVDPLVVRPNFDPDPRKNIRRLLYGAYDGVAKIERRADVVAAIYALDAKLRYGAKIDKLPDITGPQMDACVSALAKHKASDVAFAVWVWRDMCRDEFWAKMDNNPENRFKQPLAEKRIQAITDKRHEYYEAVVKTMTPEHKAKFEAMLQERGY